MSQRWSATFCAKGVCGLIFKSNSEKSRPTQLEVKAQIFLQQSFSQLRCQSYFTSLNWLSVQNCCLSKFFSFVELVTIFAEIFEHGGSSVLVLAFKIRPHIWETFEELEEYNLAQNQSWLQDGIFRDFFVGLDRKIPKPQGSGYQNLEKISSAKSRKSWGSGSGLKYPKNPENTRDLNLFFRVIPEIFRDFYIRW